MQLSELSTASQQQPMFKLEYAVEHDFASNLNDIRCARLAVTAVRASVRLRMRPLLALVSLK